MALGLTDSFWVALSALLLVVGATVVTSPIRSAYLHQVVPSEQRAMVVSFDSLVGNVGGIDGQVGLGALGEARAVGTAFVAGGLLTGAGLPLLARLRRLGRPGGRDRRRAGRHRGSVCRHRDPPRLHRRDGPARGGARRPHTPRA